MTLGLIGVLAQTQDSASPTVEGLTTSRPHWGQLPMWMIANMLLGIQPAKVKSIYFYDSEIF